MHITNRQEAEAQARLHLAMKELREEAVLSMAPEEPAEAGTPNNPARFPADPASPGNQPSITESIESIIVAMGSLILGVIQIAVALLAFVLLAAAFIYGFKLVDAICSFLTK